MPRAGDVFYLPAQEGDRTEPGKGERPWVVLAGDRSTADIVTVAYGSTKSTEALRGAAHVLVDPVAGRRRHTGLSAPTYVYPSRLASYPADALGAPAGTLVEELPAVRASLRAALGFGRGVTQEPNVAGRNLRGRIARLTERGTSHTGYEFALVVTEPAYSRRNRQQTIVPVVREENYAPAGHDVLVPGADWPSRISRDFGSAILAVPMVATFFAPEWFESYTEAVASPNTMVRVEHALAAYFGL